MFLFIFHIIWAKTSRWIQKIDTGKYCLSRKWKKHMFVFPSSSLGWRADQSSLFHTAVKFLMCSTHNQARFSQALSMRYVWLAYAHMHAAEETIIICICNITNSRRCFSIAAVNRLQPEKGNGWAYVREPLMENQFWLACHDPRIFRRRVCEKIWWFIELNEINQWWRCIFKPQKN